ncbi:putative microtubule-associated protein [Helianthus anomalus]
MINATPSNPKVSRFQNRIWFVNPDEKPSGSSGTETEDTVPGLLYDLLKKEVIALRKVGHEKNQSIKDKDDAIEVNCYLYYFGC